MVAYRCPKIKRMSPRFRHPKPNPASSAAIACHAVNKYFILLISHAWKLHHNDDYSYHLSLNQKLLHSNSSSGGDCPARVVLAPGAPGKVCRLTGQLRSDLPRLPF